MTDTKSPAVSDVANVSRDAELKRLLPAPAPAQPPPPLRCLQVHGFPYSGATLGEVLCARRVLSLSVMPPYEVAAEPLALPQHATADDLRVTSLEVEVLDDEGGDDPSAFMAEPIGALITAFHR
jgi:hypothetical protein